MKVMVNLCFMVRKSEIYNKNFLNKAWQRALKSCFCQVFLQELQHLYKTRISGKNVWALGPGSSLQNREWTEAEFQHYSSHGFCKAFWGAWVSFLQNPDGLATRLWVSLWRCSRDHNRCQGNGAQYQREGEAGKACIGPSWCVTRTVLCDCHVILESHREPQFPELWPTIDCYHCPQISGLWEAQIQTDRFLINGFLIVRR